MSLLSKTLLSVAAAVATKNVVRFVSDLDIDEVLRPVGLTRRRSHVGGTLMILGAGIVLGGGTALLLAPSGGKELRGRFNNVLDQLGFGEVKAPTGGGTVDMSNGNSETVDVHVPS